MLPPEWTKDAACLEADDPDAWFPERGQSSDPAKAVCRRCLVQADCLAYALDQGSWLPGVWGASSQRERRQLAQAGITAEAVRAYGVDALAGLTRERDAAALREWLDRIAS